MRNRKVVMALAAVAALAVAAFAVTSVGAESSQKRIKVGLVSDVGKFNDKSFNQSALEGLKRAQKQLKAQIRPVESRAASDYIPNLASLARQKYDLVISVGFLLADATNTVSKRFANTKFAIVDYPVNAPPFKRNKNVMGLTFNTNENSYLIGCMAALMAKADGGNTISAVGGIKIPPVDIFIAGYRAGARKCAPGMNVLVGYSQDFVAQDKCKTIALDQISQGSKAVFQVAGGCGLGALDAAKEQGVWGIGVDRDQAFLGAHILTSAVKRVDTSVYLTSKFVSEGKFLKGQNLVFNLENNGVALGKISSKVPTSILSQVNKLKNDIVAGKIKPPTTL